MFISANTVKTSLHVYHVTNSYCSYTVDDCVTYIYIKEVCVCGDSGHC